MRFLILHRFRFIIKSIILFSFLPFFVLACGADTNNHFSSLENPYGAVPSSYSNSLTTPSSRTSISIEQTMSSTIPTTLSQSNTSSLFTQGLTPSALRWLYGIPCSAPCIEGIVLGRTSVVDAIARLQLQPEITSVTKTVGPEPDLGRISWCWKKEGEQATLYFDNRDSSLTIYTATYISNITFTLNDVIKEYGEPTHVIATAVYGANEIIYSLRLIYLDKGFEITSDNPRSLQPKLDLSMKLKNPRFFAPGKAGFIASFRGYQAAFDLAVSWQGIKNFDFYCQDKIGCRALRDPASTPTQR